MSGTRHLEIDAHTIAYDDTGGSGTTILCLPGIGDVREVYRDFGPLLVEAGLRVVRMDLRGYGDSSVDWPSYRPEDVGGDVVALVDHLGLDRVIVVGNSMTAASAVWAAAERPATVAGLVLTGPFVRDLPVGFMQRVLLAVGFTKPLAATTWNAYYKKAYPTAPPDDVDAHRARLVEAMRSDDRRNVVKTMLGASKAACEARINEVDVPVLVVMGSRDPDFPDPAAEARTVGDLLHGEVLLVDGAGHYPAAEMPGIVAQATVGLVGTVEAGIDGGSDATEGTRS